MTRQKVKFTLVANENSRATRLKKLWSGLMKKVRELTILCDVKLCVIMFSPNDAEPMVWPSAEAARDLIGDFYALPEFVKKKKAVTIESYMNERIRKAQEELGKSRKKIMEREIDQLMVQLRGDRSMADLDVNEMMALLSFSKDKIMQLRKRLDFVEHLPLPDPPMYLFETQPEELRTTMNDVFLIGGGQDGERARNTDEGRIGTARENQTYYLVDQWVFPSPEPPNPQIHQQIGTGMASYNEIPDPRSYLPFQGSYHSYQGSSSSGNPNLEMQPIVPPVMPFHGMAGPVSQPLQHPYHGNSGSGNPNLEMQPIVPPVMPFHGMAGPISQPLQHPYQENSGSGNPNLEMQPIVSPVMPFHGMVGPVSQPLQHPYQGSMYPNLEMQPIVPPVMNVHGMVGPFSQPLQHQHSMNNNPIMAMSQPMQYLPFDDVMNNNPNIGGSQFHWSSNSMTTNDDGLRQDQPPPPPPNEATAGEGNADATSFDPNRDWPGINNHHF